MPRTVQLKELAKDAITGDLGKAMDFIRHGLFRSMDEAIEFLTKHVLGGHKLTSEQCDLFLDAYLGVREEQAFAAEIGPL